MLNVRNANSYDLTKLYEEISPERLTAYYGALNIYACLQVQVSAIGTIVPVHKSNFAQRYAMVKKYNNMLNPYVVCVKNIITQKTLDTCVDVCKRRIDLATQLKGCVINNSIVEEYYHNLEILHKKIFSAHGGYNTELNVLLKLVNINL